MIRKEILEELGMEQLTRKQVALLLWLFLSLIGLTMNDDAPVWAWLLVAANIVISSVLVKKHIKINPKDV